MRFDIIIVKCRCRDYVVLYICDDVSNVGVMLNYVHDSIPSISLTVTLKQSGNLTCDDAGRGDGTNRGQLFSREIFHQSVVFGVYRSLFAFSFDPSGCWTFINPT